MVESQDWTSEFRKAFKNVRELYAFLNWPLPSSLEKTGETYSVFIPRKLAERIKVLGPESVLAKEFLPSDLEIDEDFNLDGLTDPIGDKNYFKAPQLIHRYESRVLFTPTTVCPVHCRYCFRKNELNEKDELFDQDFEETLRYLKAHSEISELIFTGGDPLTLSNEKLQKYLVAFSEIKSLKDIRFHTRYPVIMPERIDDGLLNLLQLSSKTFRTVTVAVHANHVAEFDKEATDAVSRLALLDVQLLSQTVLLKGVNDSPEDLLSLFELFIELKIRPYYLHHPDRVKGGMHFYLPLQRGRELYHSLRMVLPGWAIPQYVIDVPGGHGKVPAFNPETTLYSSQLLTKNGGIISMREPDLFV
jgi:lysine 2,3-aminomutase